MNVKIIELSSMIHEYLNTLQDLDQELDTSLKDDISKLGKNKRSALIIAGLIENYYTCIETVFLRISQFFENNLRKDKWHKDLLYKMILTIEDIRIPVISKTNYTYLLELMKFRHFKRYYFQIDYDWRKLEYLIETLHSSHKLTRVELTQFDNFLKSLGE